MIRKLRVWFSVDHKDNYSIIRFSLLDIFTVGSIQDKSMWQMNTSEICA
jgi:hypothetical protein